MAYKGMHPNDYHGSTPENAYAVDHEEHGPLTKECVDNRFKRCMKKHALLRIFLRSLCILYKVSTES